MKKSQGVLQQLLLKSPDTSSTLEQLAEAVQKIFHFNVASAIRSISVEKGYDPRDFALVAFGGAGPTHACPIAEQLEITKVIIPTFPGVWSALGLLTADYRYDHSISIVTALAGADKHFLEEQFAKLEKKGLEKLQKSEFKEIILQRYADVRYIGQSFELQCFYENQSDLLPKKHVFEANHKKKYGYIIENEPLEIVNIGVVAIGVVEKLPTNVFQFKDKLTSKKSEKVRDVYMEGNWESIPVYDKKEIFLMESFQGPCIIEQDDTTIIILKNWICKPLKSNQHLILERIDLN